ncbi:hypothetical protein HanRHA438_Chr04g0183381 [Helianthus annuus]|nr:hypothetical protein HanIR_Chr04g0187271 [Helianthus annuus]KAJ0927482.1 hypothetical protein HanRHA438_Chr04g0183381 [Helianthus annuus]
MFLNPFCRTHMQILILNLRWRRRGRPNLKNVSNINNECIWKKIHREPDSIFLNFQTFDFIDLKKNGNSSCVRVRG